MSVGEIVSTFWFGVRTIDDHIRDMMGRLTWGRRSRSEIRDEIARLIARGEQLGEQLLEQGPPTTYAELAFSEFHRVMNRIELLMELAKEKPAA